MFSSLEPARAKQNARGSPSASGSNIGRTQALSGDGKPKGSKGPKAPKAPIAPKAPGAPNAPKPYGQGRKILRLFPERFASNCNCDWALNAFKAFCFGAGESISPGALGGLLRNIPVTFSSSRRLHGSICYVAPEQAKKGCTLLQP